MMKLIAVIFVALSQFPSEDAFKIKTRIVNGRDASEGKFPYYVYMEMQLDGGKVLRRFGGTLLNDEFVLTAAHCLNNTTTIEVHLGAADIRRPHIVFRVEKQNIFKYPEYAAGVNDIGLIRLPNKVEFTPRIQPVRLPTTCGIADNTSVVIMGNGYIKDAGPISLILQYAQSKTIPFQTCRKTFPFILANESVICALDQKNTGRNMSATCRGDSGSPLTKLDGTLIGIASSGPPSCEAGYPQIFTRVSSYTKWINNVTGLNLLEC